VTISTYYHWYWPSTRFSHWYWPLILYPRGHHHGTLADTVHKYCISTASRTLLSQKLTTMIMGETWLARRSACYAPVRVRGTMVAQKRLCVWTPFLWREEETAGQHVNMAAGHHRPPSPRWPSHSGLSCAPPPHPHTHTQEAAGHLLHMQATPVRPNWPTPNQRLLPPFSL
jgi:hypothetical protein